MYIRLYQNIWFPILMQFFMCNSFHNQLYQINLKQIIMQFIAIQFNKSTYFIILQTFKKYREKWKTNQFIYGSNRAHMHIHIKPFRFILSNKTQNLNKEGSVKNKPKKVVALQFLFSESHSWVKSPHYQPLIHHKYITIKEQPKKKN